MVKLLSTQGNVEEGQYAALSYCWGKTRQMMTTKATLPSFTKDGIKVRLLPRTLQDAISVTEQLWIRYLWIDSLCIIQNSKDDKDTEIANMAQIYKNATVTIIAAIARNCGDGFLEVRRDVLTRVSSSYRLPMKLDDLPIPADIYICTDSDLGFKIEQLEPEPIDERAWTLQEAWLSPRVLIYGRGPVRWRCLSKGLINGNEVEDVVETVYKFPFQRRHIFFQISPGPPTRSEQTPEGAISAVLRSFSWQFEWSCLARDYCSRLLTEPEDKLPALSGLASEFQRIYGDDYLAGLWKSSLPWGLHLPIMVFCCHQRLRHFQQHE
jgi:hypothetical protein